MERQARLDGLDVSKDIPPISLENYGVVYLPAPIQNETEWPEAPKDEPA